MKKIVIGNLAHVDAGKTTLSEAMLYVSKATRKMGRVDNKDAFLDTSYIEKERGITIFSKQAVFSYEDTQITLIDTPGHADFSTEMERTLSILDMAVLVISGSEGVQSHTKTLWRLLNIYNIPTIIFVNKMDQPLSDKERVLGDMDKNLTGRIVADYTDFDAFCEKAALSSEAALEYYLENGELAPGDITAYIKECRLVPVLFGSALKNEGVEELLRAISELCTPVKPREEFGAYVYKISRDEQGNRLTHMKITGGVLKIKDMIGEEKVNQIRIYSGKGYESVSEANVSDVCEIIGCNNTYAGMSLGCENSQSQEFTIPVMLYGLTATDGTDQVVLYSKIRELEEEEPSLNVNYEEHTGEITLEVCGKIQMEVIREQMSNRFGIEVEFGKGRILYKETISDTCMGVGHFEPLRHYAEVHVLLEPLPAGSGIVIENRCKEDYLDKASQNTVINCLKTKRHKGVLTGSVLTDVRISLLAGRAHKKHTEGGDFRQASSRAVRQGLMQATSVLLEPYYEFVLIVPTQSVGRAMTDIDKMNGEYTVETLDSEYSKLMGSAPVSTMYEYQSEVLSYTRGDGKLYLASGGYKKCHNQEEVCINTGYDPLSDLNNTPDSVFCAGGAGYLVRYDEVFSYMHVENTLSKKSDFERPVNIHIKENLVESLDAALGTEEIDQILNRATNANKRTTESKKREIYEPRVKHFTPKENPNLPKYLLVDGYNIIHAWNELNELAKDNFDAARGRLLDILCNYQGMKKMTLIVVFDAYKVKGHSVEMENYHNIYVVYTKEAQTADQYIESFAHENGKKYDVTVATSDGLEQMIIRGAGCKLFSAREFEEEVKSVEEYIRSTFLKE